jgi:GntR family transcriptional regulator
VAEPRYQQIVAQVRSAIRNGEFSAKQRFLTERELGRRYGVSRPTANKILSSLVAQGVLEFRKGIGTFVNDGPLDFDLQRLSSFTAKAMELGMKPETEVLEFLELPCEEVPTAVAAALELEADQTAYAMVRLRKADGRPLIYEKRYLPVSICPDIDKSLLEGSLYSVLTEHCKVAIRRIDETIRAESAPSSVARALSVGEGAPMLVVYGIGRTDGDRPLWWECTRFRGDAYEFRNRLTADPPGHPAAGVLTEATDTDSPPARSG